MNDNIEPSGTQGKTSRQHDVIEGDLDKARESIRSERVVRGDGDSGPTLKKGITGLKESFLLICTLVTSAVAVGGLIFTIIQFDKTMKAQRYATAEAAVGQFIVQVIELTTQANLVLANEDNGSTFSDSGGTHNMKVNPVSPEKTTKSDGCSAETEREYSLLDSFVVSRAQMLIDGEETGKFAGDILRFLTANQYGPYIGRRPCTSGPRVSVEGLVLVDSKLVHANVEGVFLKCLGFEKGELENVVFIDGDFQNIELNQTNLLSVDFNKAWLSEINFNDTRFLGEVDFSDAWLNVIKFKGSIFAENLTLNFDRAKMIGVNFENSQLMTQRISFEGANILYSNLSGIKYGEDGDMPEENAAEFHENLARKLSRAESLWNTQLDKPVEDILKKILRGEAYQKLVAKPEGNLGKMQAPELDWEWSKYCPPQQRRDRHFDITPSDSSLSALQTFFSAGS